MFDGGQTVYTVNNKTKEVDEWIIAGIISEQKQLYLLQRDRQTCVLPKRAIFDSKKKAQEIANKK
jgi:hypothetical protein